MKKEVLLMLCMIVLLLLCACSSTSHELKNGYYTAESAEFDSHGWKEYVTVYIRDGKIVTVEYNAKTPSGFIKSWDLAYMSNMNRVSGTYPNEYTRAYAAMFLKGQTDPKIDLIAGATHSMDTFILLCEGILDHARKGDTSVAQVVIPEG